MNKSEFLNGSTFWEPEPSSINRRHCILNRNGFPAYRVTPKSASERVGYVVSRPRPIPSTLQTLTIVSQPRESKNRNQAGLPVQGQNRTQTNPSGGVARSSSRCVEEPWRPAPTLSPSSGSRGLVDEGFSPCSEGFGPLRLQNRPVPKHCLYGEFVPCPSGLCVGAAGHDPAWLAFQDHACLAWQRVLDGEHRSRLLLRGGTVPCSR